MKKFGLPDREIQEKQFKYELKNNSAVFKKYGGIIELYKNSKFYLKQYVPSEYYDMEEEIEYIEKVKELYQEFYEH